MPGSSSSAVEKIGNLKTRKEEVGFQILAGAAQRLLPSLEAGAVGAVVQRGQQVLVFRLTITSGKIVEIHVVADPEHLRHLDLVILDAGVERAP